MAQATDTLIDELPDATSVGTDDAPGEASLYAKLGAEFFGTFILVFIGLGMALWSASQGGAAVPVGIGFGIAVTVGAIAFGHVSGGHFNPAISVASAIAGRIKWLLAIFYIVVQTAGAMFAGLVLFVVLNSLPVFKSGGTSSASITSTFKGLANGYEQASQFNLPLISAGLVEIIGTAIFAAVVLAVGRPAVNKALAPIAVGLSLAGLLSVLVPLTNGSLNPARSTAIVFFAGPDAPAQLWLFWVAPLIGGALAGLVYRGFIVPDGDNASAVAEDDDAESASEETATPSTKAPTVTAPESEAAAAPAAAGRPAAGVVDEDAKEFFDGK
ncbi:MIP/aquaporin family protein [Psychromicrobium xiongbiense]|uniref:MIP/aquaporin family protein n=1 Tax=Psychromicrobium xiongbiense TaxID=3051184 RepID=UPI002554DF9D|nr:aquaporin [Psychromicrobium sp. YIM S02556]